MTDQNNNTMMMDEDGRYDMMDRFELMANNDRMWNDREIHTNDHDTLMWSNDKLSRTNNVFNRPFSEDVEVGDLSAKDATWFLDILESYNMTTLSPEHREILTRSNLRNKTKHQVSVLFQDDVKFVLHSHDVLDQDPTSIPQNPTTRGKFLVHQACKYLATQFKDSINVKEDRSCIWSALMDRAAFYLQRSGFNDVYIDHNKNKEAAIVLGDYRISRSNFTKVFKRYIRDTDFPEFQE